MNPITRAMASLARGFLAYVDRSSNEEIKDTSHHEPAIHGAAISRSMIEKVNPWENLDVYDMTGEVWKSIDVPMRDVMISNMGRVKVYSDKFKTSKIIKGQESKNSTSHQVFLPETRDKDELPQKSVHLLTSRVVLLAFLGEASWVEKYPTITERSTRLITHKNGNFRDCRLENLAWVSEKEATKVYKRILSNDKYLAKNAKATPVEIEPVEPVEPVDLSEWRDIEHFVGFYQITRNGEVRSVNRWVHKYGAQRAAESGMPVYFQEGEINSAWKSSYKHCRGVTLKSLRLNGEKAVQLCRDGDKTLLPISRLLIENFNPTIDKSYKYDYIDGDKNNCTLANLHVYF